LLTTAKDLDTAIRIRTLKGHTDEVYAVAVTSDGRRAVSASGDLTLRVKKRGKQKLTPPAA
jgi:WD40 repeat protein